LARTPSPAAHQALIDGFVKLIKVRPIDEITTEAIARSAGSSKATLYSHWKDKEGLLIEVVSQIVMALPAARSGDFQQDAVTVLRDMFAVDRRDRYGELWPHIFSYCITHPKFHRRVHESLVERAPKHTIVGILRAAMAAGELPSDLDVEYALDLLVGPLVHHRMLHRSVPSQLAPKVVAAVWPVLRGA
jgi:AcrR family transcriptional regulator